jgi:hypothetical protein
MWKRRHEEILKLPKREEKKKKGETEWQWQVPITFQGAFAKEIIST